MHNLENKLESNKLLAIDWEKKYHDVEILYKDKAYENEELIKKINLKQTEIDTMAKEIDSWKEMTDR